jgi:hypothetical protein
MNAPGQPLFTFCIERSGKGVISSTTFGQVPIGSKQLRIRQLLDGAIQMAIYYSPADA